MFHPREFPQTRPSLLAAVQKTKGHLTWREFFDRYAPAVYRVARLRGIAPNDADDIVQEVMISIIARITDFHYDRDRGRFRDWVRRIAENKIINLARRGRRPVSMPDAALEDYVLDENSLESLWEKEWQLQDLRYCVDQVAVEISPRQLQAFRMYVFEGVSAEETGRQLEMKVGYVYVIRNQVLNLIRERMRKLKNQEKAP
ncbi:MAG: sigma-70 family RNA polymerase sigma factor [Phycisphaerales bacterium]|nr:sigma-70 family RNA polymerase sigma factor [Phycisphaerales bacterium]